MKKAVVIIETANTATNYTALVMGGVIGAIGFCVALQLGGIIAALVVLAVTVAATVQEYRSLQPVAPTVVGTDNTPRKGAFPYRRNKAGRWVDARGKFVSKAAVDVAMRKHLA